MENFLKGCFLAVCDLSSAVKQFPLWHSLVKGLTLKIVILLCNFMIGITNWWNIHVFSSSFIVSVYTVNSAVSRPYMCDFLTNLFYELST